MARATEWRRTFGSFVGGNQATNHAQAGAAVFAGETVARVRLQYQCSSFPPVPLAPWANVLLMGIWTQNNLNTQPDLDPITDAGSESWMWWEGAGWVEGGLAYATNATEPTEVISAPADGGYRDIKAQRRVLADGAVWIATAGDPAGGNQSNHWLSYAMSVLVLLPA